MEASRAAPPRGRRGSLSRLAPLGRKRPRQPEAFELLYREHAADVYRYALALLANPADAEDVTQTTFLNAYRAFQRGERPRTPHNWLIAIAHNVCRMRWRQANARPREIALDEAPEPATPEPEHDRPNLDEVLQALAHLSFNQRAALVMRELEGRSYKEIADVLDLSVGAVEALIFRARRGLRLQRRALGLLTTAPVPGSLASSFGAGGGAVAAGGAALGADLVVKAAAVVAAGAVTAGVGYKTVGAVVGPSRTEAGAAQLRAIQPRTDADAATLSHARRTAKQSTNHRADQRRATAGKPTGKANDLDPAPASEPAAAAANPAAAAAPPPTPSPTQTATGTVAGTSPVPLPPPPTVQPPPAPTVPLPPHPGTLTTPTTPTIPPPPKLP
jgi:RNA polymerase sigma-70 factor (ECF subfamily)